MALREIVENIFEKVAVFISKNAWKTVFMVVVLHVMFALCLLSLRLDNDIEHMYTVKRSETDRQTDELLPRYPDNSDADFDPTRSVRKTLYADVIFQSPTANPDNPLQQDIRRMVEYIRNTSIDIGYTNMVDLTGVCARKNNKCVIAGTDIWFLADEFEIQKLDESFDQNQSHDPHLITKIRFYLRQETAGRIDESKRWLDTFLLTMAADLSHVTNTTYVYSQSGSFLEEIDNDTYPDIPYVSFMFTVFMFYYGFLTSGGNCVTKRTHIGRMGVIVLGLGIMGSWGLLSGCGKSFTNMVGIVPYFALYSEVNMALELLSAVSDNIQEKDYVRRVSVAVREKSVVCTIVFLGHVVPYASVIYSSYRAVTTLAVYTVTTLTFVFVTHFTFFVACLAIHERRINENRHCCTCRVLHTTDDPDVQDRSCCFRCCCTGGMAETRKQIESSFERLARKLFSKNILATPIRLVVVMLFVCYLGTAAWKSCSTELDVIPENAIAHASYYSKYYDINKRHFLSTPPVMFIVNGPLDINKRANVDRYLRLFSDAKNLSFMNDSMSEFWLNDLHNLYPQHQGISIDLIKEFIANNTKYQHDIEWSHDKQYIQSFRLYVFANTIPDTKSAIDVKTNIKHFVKDQSNDCDLTVHVPSLWLFDSYRTPRYETIRFVSSQVAVVVFMFILFGNHVFSAIHVIGWHFSFVIGLLGGLALFGVSIGPVSMIMIMLGCGYNMEVVIYTLINYQRSEGTSHATRTFNVLQKTTPILFNTTFGMFCGLMVMFVQKSYVFITLLKVLATSTLLACLNATFFIPVILSIVGAGRSLNIKRQEQEVKDSQVWCCSDNKLTGKLSNGNVFYRQDDTAFTNEAFVNENGNSIHVKL